MQQAIEKYLAHFGKDRYAGLAGIRLTEASPGYAVAEMEISEKHMNCLGILHGGALFTLADFAFAVASNSHGRVALAINAEISCFRAETSGRLTAVAREISLHNKLGTYVVDITNQQGDRVAHFKGTVYRKSETIDFEKPGGISHIE